MIVLVFREWNMLKLTHAWISVAHQGPEKTRKKRVTTPRKCRQIHLQCMSTLNRARAAPYPVAIAKSGPSW
jgi:hypothetical protein